MEFNVNAADAGARLRTGVGQHTLSIGDQNVTLMINGSRAQLQRLAFDILTEAGVTVDDINRLSGRGDLSAVKSASKRSHDYEPGDTVHPMSSDPDCRVCGQTRRQCERSTR